MLTKKQFANKIVNDFCEENNLVRENITDWGKYIFMSSRLCVALEYLGLLTKKVHLDYALTRGGTEFVGDCDSSSMDNVPILSTRELLDMLPEDNSIINFSFTNISLIDLVKIINDSVNYPIEGYSTITELLEMPLFISGVSEIEVVIDMVNKQININPGL